MSEEQELVDRILKAFGQKKPVDLSPQAVARTIERAAQRTLEPGSAIHQRVMVEVEKLKHK